MDFDSAFRALTTYRPLPWQKRLFADYFSKGLTPAALDLPTGLGKTSVMAIWLIARARLNADGGKPVPRRLVYVVDRRAVVDQATAEAEKLREALESNASELKDRLELGGALPISTLRGRHVDNREWLSDPAAPAIIVGTVDMIGSRILFEGYGVSRRMRPCHAGLLGNDTLIVLDEAHLVPPFEKLLEAIEHGATGFGPCNDNDDGGMIAPLRLLSLSATGRARHGAMLTLQDEDFADTIVKQRVNAHKALTVHPLENGVLEDVLAEHAWHLAGEGANDLRYLIYCNRRATAEKTKAAIERLAKGDKKNGVAATEIATELFTGARRFLERERAAQRLEKLGFIAGNQAPPDKPVFLIATSAAEVGVDLDADHMICDLVPFERMVQRLGRVNRRGDRSDTRIEVIMDETAIGKLKDEAEQVRLQAVRQLLDHLPTIEDGRHDASPAALARLKDGTDKTALIEAATSPAPLRPALTRALVDAWSLTSLQTHTGRPQVSPWLRGWIDENPHTEIVWRAFLPWRVPKGDEPPVQPIESEVKEFFQAAPPHVTEVLETYTNEIGDTLIARARAVLKSGHKSSSTPSSDNALKEYSPAAIILSRAGDVEMTLTVGDLANLTHDKKFKEKLFTALNGHRVIMDRRLGGLSSDGLLDKTAKKPPETVDAGWDEGNIKTIIGFRVRKIEADVAGSASSENTWRRQYSFSLSIDDTDKSVLIIESWRGKGAQLKGDLAVAKHTQTLSDHHDMAGDAAAEIAKGLDLPEDYSTMLIVAARLHDQGKDRKSWQDAMGAENKNRPWAKTTGRGNGRMLNGYRHEFGSLKDAETASEIADLPEDLRELALHLIVAHHGYARPMIVPIDPDLPPSSPQLNGRARDAALRFARLQRRWGPWGLAWWEAILRAADWRASRRNDEDQFEDNAPAQNIADLQPAENI